MADYPRASLSRGMGHLADIPLSPRLRKPVLGAFAKAMGIDLREAELPLAAYGSLNEPLREATASGLRHWPESEEILASPVDGILGQVGQIQAGRIVQAKGRSYTAADLLGSAEEGTRYDGGCFSRFTSRPALPSHPCTHPGRDHTRASCPRGAPARQRTGREPDRGPLSQERAPALLHRRTARECGARGRGRLQRGRISAGLRPDLGVERNGRPLTNRREPPPPERSYHPGLPVDLGEEIMAFHLGSTVVVLVEPGRARFERNIGPEQEIRLGAALARRPG